MEIPIGSSFGFRILGFLRFALGFAKAGDPVALFPLTAFLEEFEALKALQNVPFST